MVATLWLSTLGTFATLALAIPAPISPAGTSIHKRAGANLCGQYDSEVESSGYFYLENNLWGMSSGSGWQCSQMLSTSGTTVQWYTSYSWSGGPYNVKSYANLDLKSGLPKTISSISSIPTTWNWAYTSASSDLVADVSYDLWLSTNPSSLGASSSTTYEIMIWLSTRGGAQPAGSQIGTVTVNGRSWKLWLGTVETWKVYSFQCSSGELTSYNEDLKPFITYLVNNKGVPSSQYLVQLQAGTEPFTGTATLGSTYTVKVN